MYCFINRRTLIFFSLDLDWKRFPNCSISNLCVKPTAMNNSAAFRLDLSRICAAPSARLSHFPFESDRAFPVQC